MSSKKDLKSRARPRVRMDSRSNSPDRLFRANFPPFSPSPDKVQSILCGYIATCRSTSLASVFEAYKALEPGYRLIFKRELCLQQKDLGTSDHRGKRPVCLVGHEQLIQAVVSNGDAFKVLARLLEKSRIEIVKAARQAAAGCHLTTVLKVRVLALVPAAKLSCRQDIVLRYAENGLVASWTAPPRVSLENLQRIGSLEKLHLHENLGLKRPLRSCALIGGGGGSDVIQAAALAKLLVKANPTTKVPTVISIRTTLSKSTSAGQKRSVWKADDKGEVKRDLLDEADGNLKMEPYHRGNARFVEDAIANAFENVRLVIDDKSQDNASRARYQRAIQDADSMIVVDTGGDVLGGMNASAHKKTPDQDRRTQLTTQQIATSQNLDSLVAIMAIGVDAPPDAQSKLEASKAAYYRFTPDDKRHLDTLYAQWSFDGSEKSLREHPEHYGKTPFAMLASFGLKEGEGGRFRALPLPEAVVCDFDNPWACITWVTPEMSCVVLVGQERLLGVLGGHEV